MKILDRMKKKTEKLKKEITAIYYAYQNPKVKLLPKIIAVIAIAYALSPIDLIPDFIPILGYLDDIIIIPALISLSIKFIPKYIMEESRIKAETNPLKLKDNWIFAIIFILIWIILITTIVLSLLKLFKAFKKPY